VTGDLEVGALGEHQRELLELRDAAQAMVQRLTAGIRGTL
jgi:hypothetical protein